MVREGHGVGASHAEHASPWNAPAEGIGTRAQAVPCHCLGTAIAAISHALALPADADATAESRPQPLGTHAAQGAAAFVSVDSQRRAEQRMQPALPVLLHRRRWTRPSARIAVARVVSRAAARDRLLRDPAQG